MHSLLLILPLLGALVNGLLLRNASNRTVHIVGVSPILLSFILALSVQITGTGHAPVTVELFDWLRAGEFSAPLALYFDRLAQLMLLIVTGIGTVIHVFAGGYMQAEKHLHRFFCYLNLFIFMMLLLILSENMLVMFIGWEGVGLCSYLLIGYWFSDANNAKAGMKAFVVNRIGDVGFLLAIFLTFKLFATVSFVELKTLLANMETVPPELYWITLCLFIGACGKSAQLPLHVWLPDAMAGPTPVSALIHAATMVTAGVFMMTRLHFMYELTPAVLNIVAIVGATTALFAATIAVTQRDIKKVLAYSTVSQLGYMVMACGVGAFGAGVFHLLTHACFKALLFLGAGSVIVALHHQQDMFKMGGLFKSMRITGVCMLVGVLAIIGFPGLAGFFSKDEILFLTFTQGNSTLWVMGVVTAFFTSFYMVRMFCLTFLGTPRHDDARHAHETGVVMWLPLTVLAVLSIAVGYLGVPHALGGHHLLQQYLAPVLNSAAVEHDVSLEVSLMLVSVLVMAVAAVLAFVLYRRGVPALPRLPLYSLSLHKYWLDELYDKAVVAPCVYLARFVHQIIDEGTIDATVNGIGRSAIRVANASSMAMTGSLHRYALYLLLGLASAVFILV